MSEIIVCTSCGAVVPSATKFCTTCGSKIESIAGSEAAKPSAGEPDSGIELIEETAVTAELVSEPGRVETAAPPSGELLMAEKAAPPSGEPALVGVIRRGTYKNFVNAPSRENDEGFVILSKSFLSTQKRSQSFTDDTVGDLSRSRVVSDKLPEWDPLPPVDKVVSRKKPATAKVIQDQAP
jgi:hypothetical protein